MSLLSKFFSHNYSKKGPNILSVLCFGTWILYAVTRERIIDRHENIFCFMCEGTYIFTSKQEREQPEYIFLLRICTWILYLITRGRETDTHPNILFVLCVWEFAWIRHNKKNIRPEYIDNIEVLYMDFVRRNERASEREARIYYLC